MARRFAFPLATSALVLAPCLLPARIQAGDLSSHLYNTWLVQLIKAGQMPGVWLASQRTNVLFDLMLEWLWRLFGPQAAERIAVAAGVLVFFWGAYALASALGRGRREMLVPLVGMLTYGWVYHIGLFNFYISTGLSFWMLWLLLKPNWRRVVAAVPLCLLAVSGHALPPAVALALAGYFWLSHRVRPRRRSLLLAGAILALVLTGVLLAAIVDVRWGFSRILFLTGTNQVAVFGAKYYLLELGLMGLGVMLLDDVARRRGWVRTFWDPRFHLVMLCVAAVGLLPSAIFFPAYRHGLMLVGERLSLWVAVTFCGWLGLARLRGLKRGLPAAIAMVYFVCLGYDVAALNRFEDRVGEALNGLPAKARVVSGVTGTVPALNPLTHVIDRACIGRCFSFANYEPSTAQFRVRCDPGNSFVASSYADSVALQAGGYVVKAGDPPLYLLFEDGGRFRVRLLRPGEVVKVAAVEIPPAFF